MTKSRDRSSRHPTATGVCGLLLIVGCHRPAAQGTPPRPIEASAPPLAVAAPAKSSETSGADHGFVEVFPFVRADTLRHTVEFDGWVPIDAHNPKTPRVYLEQMVCGVDSREHESLVATKAKPSNIHAALLLAGLVPGIPGSWQWEEKKIKAIPPTGQRVRVTFVTFGDPPGTEHDPATWVRLVKEDRTLAEASPGEGFVFAGSRFVTRRGREYYHADMEGTIVGLTTFGMETVAWTGMLSPETQVQTPDWIARPEVVPPVGTPVIVRVRPAQ